MSRSQSGPCHYYALLAMWLHNSHLQLSLFIDLGIPWIRSMGQDVSQIFYQQIEVNSLGLLCLWQCLVTDKLILGDGSSWKLLMCYDIYNITFKTELKFYSKSSFESTQKCLLIPLCRSMMQLALRQFGFSGFQPQSQENSNGQTSLLRGM